MLLVSVLSVAGLVPSGPLLNDIDSILFSFLSLIFAILVF